MIRPSSSDEPRCPAQSALCQIVRDLLRAVFRVLRARARDDGVEEGRGGGVAVIQRFGGALNLNVHVHALMLDGVFARDRAEALRFHPTRRLTTLDVEEVPATVEPLISRRLERRGLGPGDDEADAPDSWRRVLRHPRPSRDARD